MRIISALSGLLVLLSVSISGNKVYNSCPDQLPHTTAVIKHRDSCLQFVYVEKHWPEARDYCRLYGGKLVKVDDEDTNYVIVTTLNSLKWNNNGVWIGLHDRHKELRWTWDGDDSTLGWTNWGKGHPAAFLHSWRDCVRMVRGGGDWRWHETPCSLSKWHYRYICQYKLNTTQAATPSSNFRLKGYQSHNHVMSTESSSSSSSSLSSDSFSSQEDEAVQGEFSRHHAASMMLQEEKSHTDALPVASSSLTSSLQDCSSLTSYYRSNTLGNTLNSNNSTYGTVAGISVCILLVALLLLLLFVIRRRRSVILKDMESDEIYDDIDGKTSDKKLSDDMKVKDYLLREKEVWSKLLDGGVVSLFRPNQKSDRVQNVYTQPPQVQGIKTQPNQSVYSLEGDEEEKGSSKQPLSEDLSAYDHPREPNVYSEIGGGKGDYSDGDDDGDHIYEPLDEVKLKSEKLRSENCEKV